jgi:ABC-2 type transport system permease protein
MNASIMNRPFVTLLKREFWENKSLWIAPLAAVGLVLFGEVFGTMHAPDEIKFLPVARMGSVGAAAAVGGLFATVAMLSIVGVVTAFTYLSDCLFAERKDRSILFWKSLPVSDAQTVLSKFTVAMVALPVGLLLLALVTFGVVLGIVALRFGNPHLGDISFAHWMEGTWRFGLMWIFTLLWYAPLATYLMLCSVLAKRAPILYVLLPPLVLVVAERVLFSSSHLIRFIGGRLMPVPGSRSHALVATDRPWEVFLDPALWLGLAAAAGMLYIIIRLRRYRDDT